MKKLITTHVLKNMILREVRSALNEQDIPPDSDFIYDGPKGTDYKMNRPLGEDGNVEVGTMILSTIDKGKVGMMMSDGSIKELRPAGDYGSSDDAEVEDTSPIDTGDTDADIEDVPYDTGGSISIDELKELEEIVKDHPWGIKPGKREDGSISPSREQQTKLIDAFYDNRPVADTVKPMRDLVNPVTLSAMLALASMEKFDKGEAPDQLIIKTLKSVPDLNDNNIFNAKQSLILNPKTPAEVAQEIFDSMESEEQIEINRDLELAKATLDGTGEEESESPQVPQPTKAKKSSNIASDWKEYVEKTPDKKAAEQIVSLWQQLTAGSPIQEAIEGYDSSFRSFVRFYKDQLRKLQAKDKNKKFIGPSEMVAILQNYMTTGQSGGKAVPPKDVETKATPPSEKETLQQSSDALGAMSGDEEFKKADLNLVLQSLFKTKNGKIKASKLKGLVDAKLKTLEEQLVSESVYNRWQEIIKG